ncbi:uncharacterized protein BT62DRAFT_937240 [Guyanagaster necrorhizus]|uniref:Uncharacterized protein n=1 Tax=Guyanagaster necrorhizus TaxID=856835 RepID=A0A9P8AN27_9AGAR|nr:uncharacterized protein BT62DRAFT_937240 [Guyanagaster necrorhizus MCA 3950]KAG7441321.1 hypothetical protein BT62DRAFT_937240 [Guyanagaster necrorhizus MCA 3950]
MLSCKLARSWSQLPPFSSPSLRPNLSYIHRRHTAIFLSNVPGWKYAKQSPLVTLDPRSLSPRDFRDISNQKVFTFPGIRSYIHYARKKAEGKSVYITFPDNTAGFLYYWTHPDLPPTLGQVRFRVTNTRDPGEFDRGGDFCYPSGAPWYISLPYIAGSDAYKSICDILVRDGLVARDTIEQLRPFSESLRLMPRQITILTSPHEVFPLCLPQNTLVVYLAAGEGKRVRKISIHPCKNEELSQLVEPGKQVFALVQFEYPRRYVRNNWYPNLRIVRVYGKEGLVTRGTPSLIYTQSMYPRADFMAWFKEFNQMGESIRGVRTT